MTDSDTTEDCYDFEVFNIPALITAFADTCEVYPLSDEFTETDAIKEFTTFLKPYFNESSHMYESVPDSVLKEAFDTVANAAFNRALKGLVDRGMVDLLWNGDDFCYRINKDFVKE